MKISRLILRRLEFPQVVRVPPFQRSTFPDLFISNETIGAASKLLFLEFPFLIGPGGAWESVTTNRKVAFFCATTYLYRQYQRLDEHH